MDKGYDYKNVKLLSILAYIGPLFIMGRLAVERDDPVVNFHSKQGMGLFSFIAFSSALAFLIFFILQISVPAAAETIGILMSVAIGSAWIIMVIMGVSFAAKGQNRSLPIIGEISKKIRK